MRDLFHAFAQQGLEQGAIQPAQLRMSGQKRGIGAVTEDDMGSSRTRFPTRLVVELIQALHSLKEALG